MKRYYHIFVYTIIALAFTACVKDDFSTNSSVDQEIRFTTSVEATKASETDISALETYGKFNIATFKNNDEKNHYYTDIVSYSDGSWSAEAKRYWPAYDNLNMFAYSPFSSCVVINSSEDYDDYSLTYRCPSDITKQIDLLVKTLEDQSADNGAVPIAFEHALSGIRFNVEFENESNVTLGSISLNYVNIEKERTYDFSTAEWIKPSSPIYFNTDDGLSTSIELNENQKVTDGSNATFTDIDSLLLIIPQAVSITESSPHYISVQIAYSLIGEQDQSVVAVTTGVMPLPAPNDESYYNQGEIYTYNIIVNGETITFGEITIEDQEEPVAAYGNIDLTLITTTMTMDDAVPYITEYGIASLDNPSGYGSGYGIYDSKYDVYVEFPSKYDTESYYYYTVAQRVSNLLKSGVRDFVVVGEVGNTALGNGKMGYHGSGSNPFSLGALNAEQELSTDYQFSVDLRGTYNYPTLYTLHTDDDGNLLDDVELDEEVAQKEAIPEGFFQGVKRLTEVIVPNGIAAIGSYAFDACDGLTTVEIPDVLHIEEGGFNDCINLETVTGDNLTRIHAHGFEDCYSLTSINLSSVTEIDEAGFSNCSSLGFVDIAKVGIIDAWAFGGCTNLTFGSGTYSFIATEIGDYAFQDCPNIGSIDISHVTYIGDGAFNGNEHLTLYFGNASEAFDDLTYIGDYAFQRADDADDANGGITAMYAGENVTYIGNGAFGNCHKLYFVDGYNVYPNVETIGSNAFISCTTLGELDITNASIIGSYAFYGCENFTLPTDETIFSNLTSLGAGAFNGCTLLNGSISFPNIGSLLDINTFNSASSVTKLNLPTITEVGKYGLNGCSNLEEVYMPNISVVAENSFQNSPKLGVFDISGLSSIGESAFSACTSLQLPTDETTFDNLTSLGASAFKTCSSLNGDLTFPVIDETLNSSTFYACSSITSLNLPTITSIGSDALSYCTSLESIVMESLTSLTWDRFTGCSGLKEVNLPNFTSAFDCVYLRTSTDGTYYAPISKLILPKVTSLSNLTNISSTLEYLDISSYASIGYQQFYEFANLKTLVATTATQIGYEALYGCTSLEELYIPNSTNISYGMLGPCSNLTYIDMSSPDLDVISYGANPFDGLPDDMSNCTLVIDEGYVAKWEGDSSFVAPSGNTWLGITFKEILYQ